MQEYGGYVYILANGYKRLYTGVTAQLVTRVRQHKNKIHPKCFTARYNMTQLVYFEALDSIEAAIRREKQIKGWLRVKKLALIVEFNPTWRDLYAEICIPKTYQPGEEREPETFF